MPIGIAPGPRVYVAGPYTVGDTTEHVRRAMKAADALMRYGYAPFVPHLSHFMQLMYPRTHEEWLAHDKVWLAHCDYMLRLPGESRGADMEEAFAKEQGIPVFEGTANEFDRHYWETLR